jgi:hypothetical protein
MRWIIVVIALALPMPAAAQSMRECHADDGSVYLTHQQCSTPQPYVGIVRKCVGPGNEVSFQQDPCPAGARQVTARDATPEPPLSYEQRQARAARADRDRRESAYLSRLAGTDWIGKPQPQIHMSRVPDQRDQQRANCRSARQSREDVLKNNPNQSVEALIQLNDMVTNTCRGL